MSQGVAGGVNPSSLRGQSQMSSEQVQSEIQAIDSILQALSTGDYGLASMRGVAQLTGTGEATASQVTPPSLTYSLGQNLNNSTPEYITFSHMYMYMYMYMYIVRVVLIIHVHIHVHVARSFPSLR